MKNFLSGILILFAYTISAPTTSKAAELNWQACDQLIQPKGIAQFYIDNAKKKLFWLAKIGSDSKINNLLSKKYIYSLEEIDLNSQKSTSLTRLTLSGQDIHWFQPKPDEIQIIQFDPSNLSCLAGKALISRYSINSQNFSAIKQEEKISSIALINSDQGVLYFDIAKHEWLTTSYQQGIPSSSIKISELTGQIIYVWFKDQSLAILSEEDEQIVVEKFSWTGQKLARLAIINPREKIFITPNIHYVISTQTKNNAITIKSSTQKEQKIRLPPPFSVQDAQIEIVPANNFVIISGSHDAIRKKWQRMMVVDMINSLWKTHLTTNYNAYPDLTAFDIQSNILIVEDKSIDKNLSQNLHIYNFSTNNWQTYPINPVSN